MTVSTTTATKTYDGDGSTTDFPTVFVFGTAADIEVIERTIATGAETIKTLTTDYTVTGGGGAGAVPATGTVVANSAPAATVQWTLRRVVAETQETGLPVAGSLPSSSVENMVDRAIMSVQQHTEELGRALSFPKTDADSLSNLIPNSVDRAGKFLGFDGTGAPIATEGSASVETGFADGTAAAPSITFAADSDNGLFRPGANEFGVTTAGSERFRINATGQILIGHTTADTGGAVGGILQIHGTSPNTSGLNLFSWQSAGGSGGENRLVFAKSRSATPGSHTVVQFEDLLGRIVFAGDDGDDLTSQAANIFAVADAGVTDGNMPGRLVFGTTAVSESSPTERMRIDRAGRVVLGGTAADQAATVSGALQVHGTDSGTSSMNLFSWQNNAVDSKLVFAKSRGAAIGAHAVVQTGDVLGRIVFAGDDGSDLDSQAASISVSVDASPGSNDMPGRLVFATTADGAAAPTEALRITSGQLLRPAAASWTANGTNTVTISNVAPAGVGTATISKWLTVEDNTGTVYFIPAWT